MVWTNVKQNEGFETNGKVSLEFRERHLQPKVIRWVPTNTLRLEDKPSTTRLQHFFATYPMFDTPYARRERKLTDSNENRQFHLMNYLMNFYKGIFY